MKKIEKREKNVKKVEKRGGEKIEWRGTERRLNGSVHEVSRSEKHRHTCEYNRTQDVQCTMCAIPRFVHSLTTLLISGY